MTDVQPTTPAEPDVDIDTKFDMGSIADVVVQAVKEHAPVAMKEAIAPYVEKSVVLEKYADVIVELERKKQELNTSPEEKGFEFARRCRLIALGKGDVGKGIREARTHRESTWAKDDPTIMSMEKAEKALTASDPGAAGSLIPPAVSAEFIDLLRNMAVMRSIARVIPMPFGHLSLRKQTSSATSTYAAESANTSSSQGTVGSVNLNFKTLITITPVSNSLLRYGGSIVDGFVRDDLLRSQAVKEDLEFFTGNGDDDKPVGVLNRTSSATPDHLVAESGVALTDVIPDYVQLPRLLETANVPVTEADGHYVMHPQVFWGIFAISGATALTALNLANQLSNNRLFGYATHRTVQVGTSNVYFLHGPSMLIGDSMNVEVTAIDGAAYFDGSNVVSGLSRDETVIKATSSHDFNMRHDAAAAILQSVTIT